MDPFFDDKGSGGDYHALCEQRRRLRREKKRRRQRQMSTKKQKSKIIRTGRASKNFLIPGISGCT